MSFPEATERLSHGEPTWFIRDKRVFAMLSNNHHNDGVVGFWCPAPEGAQETLVAASPDRFYRPPYVGGNGWLGVRLDVPAIDWDEIAFLVGQAYRHVAPKKLLALLDG
jgi:hypothetical protein